MNNNSVRITATGPFFELDFVVSEKKAATELRKLKKYLALAVHPTKEEFLNRYRYRSRKWNRIITPQNLNFVAENHGVEKTKIEIRKEG